MDGDKEKLEETKEIVRDLWVDFIDNLEAKKVIDAAFSYHIIDETVRDKMLQEKDRKEATRYFLLHLEKSATNDTLWKVHKMLQEKSKYHASHKHLYKALERRLTNSRKRHVHPTDAKGFNQEYQALHKKSRVGRPFPETMSRKDGDLVGSRTVEALDVKKSKLSYGERLSQAGPPDRCLKHDFHKMLVVVTEILNCFIDHLKPMLRDFTEKGKWPFNKLLLENIDEARSMSDIFTKIRIEKCWLNTEVLICLVDAVAPSLSDKVRKRVDFYLEDYNHKLGIFTHFVLLKHVPADELTCGGTQNLAQTPNLLVTSDKEYESFTVADLLDHKDFLCTCFDIPPEQFQYVESKATQSILVVWALVMPSSQAFCILDKAKMAFWQLKEHGIIKLEIEGMFQLCLRGNHLPYYIKEGFQWNQDFVRATEEFSHLFLALVDFESVSDRKGTLHCSLKEAEKTSVSIVDNLDPGIHSHGESKADDHEKEEITNLLEDPPESAAESKQAEVEQRREAERRGRAEEERLIVQKEKEEAQRKLEEYLKKPTFNERRIEADVYRSGLYKWEYVHSAEARDVATGITAKAKNYKSKGGAIEHAKLSLKAILLDKGIIRKDDI